MKNYLNDWQLWLIASLTLGLAPFSPEPHLIGKLRWVMGGAVGMGLLDFWDLFIHGMPWVMFLRSVFLKILLNKNVK